MPLAKLEAGVNSDFFHDRNALSDKGLGITYFSFIRFIFLLSWNIIGGFESRAFFLNCRTF